MSAVPPLGPASDVDVVDTIRLEPDARLVKTLGAHHTFESAIADLVDNCVDAHASQIVIRLLSRADRLHRVEVIDNGDGMDSSTADHAMTLGHQRTYGSNDLGHFGVGLKSASFGHSDELSVWSSMEGERPVGRRIKRLDFSRDFSCDVLSDRSAAAAQQKRAQLVGVVRGTTVVWTALRSTYRGANADEARTWMSELERKLRGHLGITFHRLIDTQRLSIRLVVGEVEQIDESLEIAVRPIDPFAYAQSGRPGYPKAIATDHAGQPITLNCHIWPAKTDTTSFRLYGKPGENFQGFFVYRNDRLLQLGGWSDVANSTPHRQLARVVIEYSGAIDSVLTMNSEKSGLRAEPAFRDALVKAIAEDGTTFDQYLLDAEDTYRTAAKRTSRRHPVIMPTRGFAPLVRKRVSSEVGFKAGEKVDFRWTKLPAGELFRVDFANTELLLNSRYRDLFAPQGGSLNDAPVLKSLMFLLTHQIFESTNLGPKDKDNLALWGAILGSAVETEREMRRG
ncbi:DNA mismatch repair protein [Rhodococcus sp. Leaf278]|nr:DNA mismatch repair protein [Rhodococcus sp. Leaf278]